MPAGDPQPSAAVAVEALGRFRVLREGVAVPRSAWRSRKARDLLKMLVARHGRPVSRDALIEALWPEEDPARCANRLSVALSTLRGVLDASGASTPTTSSSPAPVPCRSTSTTSP